MVRTLSRGVLVLPMVLVLLAVPTDASGVHNGPRGRPGGSPDIRPSGFGVPTDKQSSDHGEVHEKHPPVPGQLSVTLSSDSDKPLNRQSPSSVLSTDEGFPELIRDQSGIIPPGGQSPDIATKPPSTTGDLTSGQSVRPPGGGLDGADESPATPYEIQNSEPDVGCAAYPAEPQACAGFDGPRQSPINIDPCSDQLTVDRRPLRFKNVHAVPTSMLLMNTGNRVTGALTWANISPATISGGNLPGTFVYEAFDMHWGANSSYGSEHTINNYRYAAEIHLTFRNIEYETFEEALFHVDGTAVIAVFFDAKAASHQRGLAPLAESLFQIKEAYRRSEVVSPPSLRQLLPRNLDQYVIYSGSPASVAPCWGTVSWVVMLHPVKILDIELDLLRDLRDKNGDRLCESTIRPLQYVSGRKLYTRQRFWRCLFRP